MIAGWIITAVLAVLTIICFLGGGAYLSTWYNSIPSDEREQYSKKKVSMIMGIYYFVLCITLALFLMFLSTDVSDILRISVSVIYLLLVVLFTFYFHKNSYKNCKK